MKMLLTTKPLVKVLTNCNEENEEQEDEEAKECKEGLERGREMQQSIFQKQEKVEELAQSSKS